MTWQPGTPRPARDRAQAALQADPGSSDYLIAAAAGCSRPTVRAARRALEAAGMIPAVPPAGRARQPAPMRLAGTAVAILLGATTTAKVAVAAGCSRQAALKALKRQRHWPDDTAAARDRLQVAVLGPCERCGASFTPRPAWQGGPRQRFCSRRCQHRALTARALARAAEFAAVTQDWPGRRELAAPQGTDLRPPAALLLSGLCCRPGARPYWTSDSPADREQAVRICRGCEVRVPFRHDWAVSMPPAALGDVIVAGLDAAGRRQARRTRW